MHRSDEMFRMVGRDRTELERDPRAWLQVVHPDDVDGVVEALHKTRDQGTDYHRQYRILWPDGSVRWIESQGKSQRNSDGQITKVVGVMADVTHRKLAEEAMLRAEKLAVAGRLAASVAHEINNPLEAVANLLYLITLADAVEDAQEQAGKALEQLMRVSQITQQTLKFHRQTGLPRSVNLSEVVDGVLSFFRSKLAQAGVAVKLRAEAETAVPCMPSEAQQIFANLVTNAIDAMPHGGRLTIRLRPSLDWRDRATRGMRITFADSGVGMSRDTLRRIFEPFFTTKLDIGTGLGMWVVAQLVERHNGQVRVWSTQREGRSGTAFSIFLPLDSKPPREVISGAADAAGSEGMQDRALIRG
jgi:PAS domain S-box-containing protein